MNRREAKRHALWLVGAWAEGTEGAGAVLQCPQANSDSECNLVNCPDCLWISEALHDVYDELLRRGQPAPGSPPTRSSK